jgi:signal transduction histidine kinase
MISDQAASSTRTRPQQLLDLARLVTRADLGGIALLSAQGELVDHLTGGVAEGMLAAVRHAPWVDHLVRFVLRQPGAIALPNWPEGACPPADAGLPAIGTFIAMPLTCPGRCRGVAYLGRRHGSEPFAGHDLEAFQSVGHFLEEGSLFEEARLLARVRLLTQVAQAAAGSLELAPILRVAVRELDRLLPMQVCAVWLVEYGPALGRNECSSDDGVKPRFTSPFADPNGGDAASEEQHYLFPADDPRAEPAALVLADTSAGSGGLAPASRLLLSDTPFAACVRNGEPFYTDLDPTIRGASRHETRDARRDARPQPCFSCNVSRVSCLGIGGAACCFAVALRAGDRTVGVLQSVCLRRSGFTADQLQLLHLVADLLGPAISNCQLFGRLSSAYEALRHTQNQLVQTEKMRALGELAGGMAHEFNNALCGALGFLELTLRNPEVPPSARDTLDSARLCCLDAAQTVSRVQDFARWRRDGSVHLVDLNSLVRQTIELARHKWESLARARGTPIQVEVRTEARARIAGSPNELREVLTNLVFNAVDAMPDGGALTVRTWSAGSYVYFSVSDTGVGIPDGVRRRLFEPFFTTKGDKGNGLGLSVSFGIVRRHGGEINVSSRPDQGATFTVRLPARIDSDERWTTVRHTTDTAVQTTTPDLGRSLRVLVVEDEESIRLFLGAGLTGLGHRPVIAGTVREGLEAFARERFDVVLTDLGLPEESGEDLARAVRARSPQTPVVLLTGWADQLHAEGTSLEGIDRVLAKPVTLSTLASTLAAVCP